MANKDNRQVPFTRVLTKHAGRARERILQNFGKADRTTDEDFDVYVKNFSRQQAGAVRLQKEFRNYHQCVKAMQVARRSLMETVCELYEPCWVGLSTVMTKADMLNQNYEEFCEKVNENVLVPVAVYVSQFPELNNKINKRNRKLLDYDNSRHNFENLDSMKKREETKITKAKEQFEEKKSLFEVINSELHDELPTFYESRVKFFVSHLQSLFCAEAEFHSRDSVLLVEINCILEKLEESKKEFDGCALPSLEYKSNQATNDTPPIAATTGPNLDDTGYVNSGAVANKITEESTPIDSKVLNSPADEEHQKENNEESNQEKDGYSSGSASGSCCFSTPPTTNARTIGPDITAELGSTECEPQKLFSALNGSGDGPEANYQVLYKVKSTYAYVAEDVDELSFNVGDIIDVVAFEDPDEQEEGWLSGVSKGVKGLFPANFTTRI